MTRIDFYVLPEDGADRALTSCRITAKAFAQRHRVFLLVDSPEAGERLDDMLWTFRDVSFVPHRRSEDTAPGEAPVVIGRGEPPPEQDDVLINLTEEVPLFFSRFERVVEFAPAAGDGRTLARERYRFYQDRGYALETHRL